MPDEIIHECSIDETMQEGAALAGYLASKLIKNSQSLAREVIGAREYLAGALYPIMVKHSLDGKAMLLAYSCEHPSRRKRKPMDIDAMVKAWVPLVKELAIAHTIDDRDAASSQLDDLLLPVVGAPIAQIRSFYRQLTDALKADPQVPWCLWRLFDYWRENVLDKIDKEEIVGLKTEIAKRIAERSMTGVPREDWINAMVGALQWRSPEKLAEIEKKMEAGEKPRVRGKESCLFLAVGESEVML